jgi:geranylgeranyl diphosphate synthase type II
MDAHGCIEYARDVANGLAGAALAEFAATYGHLPPSRDKAFIEALVTWVIERA